MSVAPDKIRTSARLICPMCGQTTEASMPLDACQYFFECPQCRQMLMPKQGDCCVFCSYADVQCPSKQMEER